MEKNTFYQKREEQFFIIFKYIFPLIVVVVFAIFYSRNPDYDALAEGLFFKSNTHPNPIDVFWNSLTQPNFNANPYAHIISDPIHYALGSFFFYFVHEGYIALALSAAVFAGLCVFMLINIFELFQKPKSRIIVFTLLSFSGAFIYVGTVSSTAAFQIFFLLLWIYFFLKCLMNMTKKRYYVVYSTFTTAFLPFVYLGYALIIIWLIFIAIIYLLINYFKKRKDNQISLNSLYSYRFWLYYFALSLIFAMILAFINALLWNISIISYFLNIIPADQRYGLGSLVGFSSGLPTSPSDFLIKVFVGFQYFLYYISPSTANFLFIKVSTRIGVINLLLGMTGIFLFILVILGFSLLDSFKNKHDMTLIFILFTLLIFNVVWWSFWDILPKFWVIPYFLLLIILNAEFHIPKEIEEKFILDINENFTINLQSLERKAKIGMIALILMIFLTPNIYAMIQSNTSNDSGLIFAQDLQNYINKNYKSQNFVVISRSTEYMAFQYVLYGNSQISSVWLKDLTQKQFDGTVNTTKYLIYTAMLTNPTPIKLDVPIPLWLKDYINNATIFFTQTYSNVYVIP